MSVHTDPRLGTELAGYRIERLLGRGGMSVVYLAEDTRLGRKVALKLLAPELAEDERFRERFLRESRLAASIDHSNVIPIYEAGEAEGHLFIAMRYVEGTDLKELLATEHKLEPARALAILDQVASALDAAHARGLVHRDVKPANILLDAQEDNHVYLSDFGLTKQASSESGLTQTGQFMGTADYVAPEQIEREPVGPATDEYALACVIYECLSGRAPFRSDSLMGTLWGQVHDQPPPLSDALDPVFATGMAKDPADRYPTCRELVQTGRAALGLSGETPAPDGQAPTPLLRRREFLVGAGVAVLAVAGAIPAVLLTRGRGETAGPPLAPPNALARIDAETNDVTMVVPDLPVTYAVTSGEGAVWVLSNEGSAVVRVDPETFAVTSRGVPGSPFGIAAGLGAVWVVTSFEGVGYLLSLDPQAAGAAPRRIRLEYSDPRGVVVAGESVWVLAYNSLQARTVLLRFPAAAGLAVEPLDEVAIPGQPIPGAVGHWLVADARDLWLLAVNPGLSGAAVATLYRIDHEGREQPEPLATFDLAESLAVGSGSVWATTQSEPRTVFRVDPTTGSVTGEPWGTRDPGPLLVAHSSLWIGDFLEGTVARIDPASGDKVGSTRVSEAQPPGAGGPPGSIYTNIQGAYLNGLAADESSVWALTTSSVIVI